MDGPIIVHWCIVAVNTDTKFAFHGSLVGVPGLLILTHTTRSVVRFLFPPFLDILRIFTAVPIVPQGKEPAPLKPIHYLSLFLPDQNEKTKISTCMEEGI